jgi:hypothetical protein
MVYVPVQCPHCQSTEVIKAGKQANGAQRYQCQNGQCTRQTFPLGSVVHVMLCRRSSLKNINVIRVLLNFACPPALPV